MDRNESAIECASPGRERHSGLPELGGASGPRSALRRPPPSGRPPRALKGNDLGPAGPSHRGTLGSPPDVRAVAAPVVAAGPLPEARGGHDPQARGRVQVEGLTARDGGPVRLHDGLPEGVGHPQPIRVRIDQGRGEGPSALSGGGGVVGGSVHGAGIGVDTSLTGKPSATGRSASGRANEDQSAVLPPLRRGSAHRAPPTRRRSSLWWTPVRATTARKRAAPRKALPPKPVPPKPRVPRRGPRAGRIR